MEELLSGNSCAGGCGAKPGRRGFRARFWQQGVPRASFRLRAQRQRAGNISLHRALAIADGRREASRNRWTVDTCVVHASAAQNMCHITCANNKVQWEQRLARQTSGNSREHRQGSPGGIALQRRAAGGTALQVEPARPGTGKVAQQLRQGRRWRVGGQRVSHRKVRALAHARRKQGPLGSPTGQSALNAAIVWFHGSAGQRGHKASGWI